MSHTSSSGWFLMLIISLLFTMTLGVGMVWVSIDRSDLAFHISQSQRDLASRIALHHKLEIERDRLLALGDLRHKAERMGMTAAQPWQIRRLPSPETSLETR